MLQAILTALPILILEIGEDGTIIKLDSDSPSVFGSPLEKFLGVHLGAFFPKQIAKELELVLWAIAHGEQPPILNFTSVLEDGNHWFEARFIPSNRTHSIAVIQDITKYKLGEARIQKQFSKMSALRAIDHAISSSADLNLTLSILLTQVVKHLQIDAACILLWNSEIERLEFVAGLGFRTNSLGHTKLKLGEGYAGIAALEGRIIQKIDLPRRGTDFLRSPTFSREDFVSYFGVPLIAKKKLKGVLEIFNRSALHPDSEWLAFLEMLGGQAAIALDNASLFHDLQRTNTELISAYDATIQGWSRALDMRDHETKDHTYRVTKMTVDLANKIEIPSAELIHIQRGATLHDIGKMGIPDHILYKPGPLSKEEWHIMRQHPRYAYELLSPIEYLRPAKEIPYSHHERWDGSGYPLGLSGEEIPLSARMFAVVDVYDALVSDRPYRSAWSKNEALHYLQEQKGILFDPNIVSAFLDLIEEKEIVISKNQKELRV